MLALGCGARSGLRVDERNPDGSVGSLDADVGEELEDAAPDATSDGEVRVVVEATCADEPQVLAEGWESAYGVTANDTHVYWTTTDGEILRTPICGGPTDVVAQEQSRPLLVGLDERWVYWTSHVGLWRAPLLAGGAESVWQTEGPTEGLAVDHGEVFFTVVGGTGRGLWRLDTASGFAERVYSGHVGRPVALDADHVFFGADDQLWRIAREGGPRDVAAPDLVAPDTGYLSGALTVDEDFVYWSSWHGPGGDVDNVFRAPKDGGLPEVLARGERGPVVGVQVSRTHIYWTSQWDGAVRVRPIHGGDVTTLATNQDTVESLFLSEAVLFWVNFGDGNLWRLPTP
ncbi:MAG: hypothetical protein AAGF12_21970 [Myxococcota bacterium]